ncbi:MarR family winged helix-turn-helix transcriptional regulator [Pseudoprimorskyibacter insulae]|uniref:HTH marR-type domain-containing protein n=1 Tax=Pseudoprimorskyibacter insulae TaxID=1695997 RepID=A0A2R8AY79_9RHOB|nr:MarR family winged helix-turn-helix transcriptional regulator [Pseudoprimorskyibacter insulae]SPF80937.1 hypothetical protein PRI8871_02750 [Pseudoprimorskyibacter insulae]
MPQSTRLSSPVKTRDGVTILDIDNYAPFLLNAVSSAWQRKTAAIYRDRFGLGIVEWRIIAMLNIEPGITANRICAVIRLDKAAASRTLKVLDNGGYLRFEADEADARKKRWWLSEKGLTTHDTLLDIALECEAAMIGDIEPAEYETFLKVMRAMLGNLSE